MRRRLRVFVVLVPFFCGAQILSAQDPGTAAQTLRSGGFQLDQNYPNPFNPETTIPFTLGEELFAEGRAAVVSLRIFNILAQIVAHPVALRHPAGEGVELNQLEFTQPGRYEAFWDGTDTAGRQVASGMYFMQLTVNGETAVRKMLVTK